MTFAFVGACVVRGMAATAAETAPAPNFAVLEYRVLGNSVLPVRAVEGAVYPFLGPNKSFADVQQARDALQAAYRAHDYATVIVDIPEQSVQDGVVRLRVTEGRIHARTISGARYFSEKKILDAIPASTPGTVPKIKELQRQINAVNAQTHDRAVTPILKAGPVPGTVDLALKVDDHLPLHGSAELNNQYTVGTTHTRAAVAVDYANAFDTIGDLGLQYQTSPADNNQVGVFVAGYTTGPLAYEARASFTYIHSSSSVPAAGSLGVLGKGDIYEGRITLPVAFSPETTQSVFFDVAYKDFTQDIAVDPTTSLNTPIPYINFSPGFQGDWRGESRNYALSSNANFGMTGVVNDPGHFAQKRFMARPNYFYLRQDATVIQMLPSQWSLRLRLAGQYTVEPLISNEMYSIAGADGVRGYLEAEQLGDSAIKGTLQLDTPAWHLGSRWSGQMFSYFDYGRMHIIDALPDTPDHAVLKSVGAGLDWSGMLGLTGSLTWAYPLANSTATSEHDSRVLFLVRGAF